MGEGSGGRRGVPLDNWVVVAMSLLFLFFSLGTVDDPTLEADGLPTTTVSKIPMAIPADFLRKVIKMSATWGASFDMISATKKIY